MITNLGNESPNLHAQYKLGLYLHDQFVRAPQVFEIRIDQIDHDHQQSSGL